MDMPATQEPLDWLAHLELLCARYGRGLPQQQETDDEWVGIGFRVGNLRLISPLGDIVEILSPPAITSVPGTKSWVCGIANVRGNIMPIMDVQGYLRGSRAEMTKHTRVLVINHNGVYSGLIVDAVLGLQHFSDEHASHETSSEYNEIEQYLVGGFLRDGVLWRTFSVRSLAETPEFLQAAV